MEHIPANRTIITINTTKWATNIDTERYEVYNISIVKFYYLLK